MEKWRQYTIQRREILKTSVKKVLKKYFKKKNSFRLKRMNRLKTGISYSILDWD